MQKAHLENHDLENYVLEMQLEMQKAHIQNHALETYKSLIQIGGELSRFCMIANGGAATALLLYLGNVAGKGHVVPNLVLPMFFYVFGVFFNGLFAFTSWHAQHSLYNEDLKDLGFKNIDVKSHHMVSVRIALLMAIMGIFSFIVGSILAVLKFQSAL